MSATDLEIIRLAQRNMVDRGGHAITREDVRRAQRTLDATLTVAKK